MAPNSPASCPVVFQSKGVMGAGYFYHNFFSCLDLPLAFKVDNKPYFCTILIIQFLRPISAYLLTLFLILSNSF
ncbi:hypothetical protein [uncultured Gammaproteobacteria bacterium]|nr:hypothetical protein BROOK1789B_440 [Bathymodiolus brooksi thiotrophic gill symbiont]CAC9533285.1 hypothetical protein [uncultured Gammaproteobacteria bacterium]CAB9542171.1 hypothetical protein BROOK1789C_49 [Bathymodiolus brooksi thiotrophic gill symbiont]CAC9537254.1 hypothetical protein [uncultured Gammaproteobacteria bacterium]CAC9559443.1 hypothetical protein [uncultured Gammaproteobacteria bacterium]